MVNMLRYYLVHKKYRKTIEYFIKMLYNTIVTLKGRVEVYSAKRESYL